MKLKYSLSIILFFFLPLSVYNFADIAHKILEDFNSKKIRSSFGKDLYEEIQRATNNFSTNLTFDSLKKYVDTLYLDYMATKIVESDSNTFIALIWPVTVGQDERIETIFNKYCDIICYKRIMLDHRGARNLLDHMPTKATHPTGLDLWFKKPFSDYNPLRVYLIRCKENSTDYNVMKSYLIKIFSGNKEWIDNLEKKYGKKAIQNLFVTTTCKREIRRAVNIGHAMHINDTHDETEMLGNIVFNENSIVCLKFSQPELVKRLPRFNEFRSLLKTKLGNKINDIVIYNSAVLSAFGLRDCNDIDFLHDPRIPIPQNMHLMLSNQNQFFKRLYVILEDLKGKHYILEDCPTAFNTINLDQPTTVLKQKISIDELLYNPVYYFHFHELKYATLEFMHYYKEQRGREKDNRDIKLIEDHFSTRYN